VALVISLGVLVSGSGSNLQSIIDSVEAGTLDARVAVVVSNVARARAVERARAAGIPTHVVDHRSYPDRSAFDASVAELLRARGADLVVLAGFMRVVSDVLLDAFPWRIVNIHPALLPAFPGLHGPRQAIEAGVCIAGCTVHFVDRGMDTGPIIAQAAVPVLADDDEASLAERILEQEHVLVARVLQWFAEGRVEVLPSSGPGTRPRVVVHGASTSLGLRVMGR
jgi:phosphoribosylglycinamide formyltransferase-1